MKINENSIKSILNKLMDKEDVKIEEAVKTLKEATKAYMAMRDEYLQNGEIKKANEAYTKVADMYNQIADKMSSLEHRESLRALANFWARSGETETFIELLPLKKPHKIVKPTSVLGRVTQDIEPKWMIPRKPSEVMPTEHEPRVIKEENYPNIILGRTYMKVLPKIAEIPAIDIKAEISRKEEEYLNKYIEIETKKERIEGHIKKIERMKAHLRGVVEDIAPIPEMEYLSKKHSEEMVKELSAHDSDMTYR